MKVICFLINVFVCVISYNTTALAQFYNNPDYKVIVYYNTQFLGEKVNRIDFASKPSNFLNNFFLNKDSVIIKENPNAEKYFVLDDGDSILIDSPYELETMKYKRLYYETTTFKDYLKLSQFWYVQVKPQLVRDKKKATNEVFINCMYIVMNKTGLDIVYICWDGSIVYDNKVYMPNRSFVNYLKSNLDHIEFDESNLPPLPTPKLPRR